MAQTPPLPIDPTPTPDSDWPILIDRMADDALRILRSEAHILQTGVLTALNRQISKILMHLTIVGMLICGALFILCAAVLLLHQWLPWWQVFAIAGLFMLVVAFVVNIAIRPRSAFKT